MLKPGRFYLCWQDQIQLASKFRGLKVMPVSASYIFLLVTSGMCWKFPEACSCGKCAHLMLPLCQAQNPHVRPTVPSSSGLHSFCPAPLPAAALLAYRANPAPAQAGSMSASTLGNICHGHEEIHVPQNCRETFPRVSRSFKGVGGIKE